MLLVCDDPCDDISKFISDWIRKVKNKDDNESLKWL